MNLGSMSGLVSLGFGQANKSNEPTTHEGEK